MKIDIKLLETFKGRQVSLTLEGKLLFVNNNGKIVLVFEDKNQWAIPISLISSIKTKGFASEKSLARIA